MGVLACERAFCLPREASAAPSWSVPRHRRQTTRPVQGTACRTRTGQGAAQGRQARGGSICQRRTMDAGSAWRVCNPDESRFSHDAQTPDTLSRSRRASSLPHRKRRLVHEYRPGFVDSRRHIWRDEVTGEPPRSQTGAGARSVQAALLDRRYPVRAKLTIPLWINVPGVGLRSAAS
jgi:hypothetical protein